MNLFTTIVEKVRSICAGVTLATFKQISAAVELEVTRPAAEVFLLLMKEYQMGDINSQVGVSEEIGARQCYSFIPHPGVHVTFEFRDGVPPKEMTATVVVYKLHAVRIAKYLVAPLLRKHFGQVFYSVTAR